MNTQKPPFSAPESINRIPPFLVIIFLYFIIGIFTVINQQFQVPLQSALLPHDGNITNALVTMLNFSWFLAYPFSEGFGTRFVNRYGYKNTSLFALGILILGLLTYELAVLYHIHRPSHIVILGNRISAGFFIFLGGSFIIGTSAALLQIVMNLYLALCPVGNTTALQRQMIGGTTNSAGMAIAPLIVSYLMFHDTPLRNVQATQFTAPVICLTGFILLSALITWGVRMPGVSKTATKTGVALKRNILSFRHLKLGIWGIFFYVGVEVCVGANINMFATNLGKEYAASATHMAALYWSGILAGRLLGSFIKTVSPQTQLVYTSIGSTGLLILAMLTANPWILAGIGLFHSVMWPDIFTLAVDKLGAYTARGSGILMIGVMGGGVLPFLQGILADLFRGDWRWTWIIVVLGELYILFYGLHGYRIRQTDNMT